jgi:hypothetical protein
MQVRRAHAPAIPATVAARCAISPFWPAAAGRLDLGQVEDLVAVRIRLIEVLLARGGEVAQAERAVLVAVASRERIDVDLADLGRRQAAVLVAVEQEEHVDLPLVVLAMVEHAVVVLVGLFHRRLRSFDRDGAFARPCPAGSEHRRTDRHRDPRHSPSSRA